MTVISRMYTSLFSSMASSTTVKSKVANSVLLLTGNVPIIVVLSKSATVGYRMKEEERREGEKK